MASWTEEELEKIHRPEFRKKERLKESGQLGCFSCGYIFSFYLVEHFIEREATALCPICGIDAVIPLADFPKSEHNALLDEMYFKFLADRRKNIPLLMGGHFYLCQKKEQILHDAYNEIENILEKSKRKIEKNVYEGYDYAQSVSFQINSGLISIYPLNRKFVEHLFPEFYKKNNQLKEKEKVLKKMTQRSCPASFLINLPSRLTAKEAEYMVKLLGMAFGGYFSSIADLPPDGVLTKKKNIYIQPYSNQKLDIIASLEKLLKKYG